TREPGAACIWRNVRGGYRLGCVRPDGEYEALRTEIVETLGQMTDEQGRATFARVYRREELYRGPYVGDAPDVVAVCAPHVGVIYASVRRDLRARSLFGPFAELGFTGRLHADGRYLIAGSEDPALGSHRESAIESIARTTLHLLGLPVPRGMEGPVGTSFLREEFLLDPPVCLRDDDTDAVSAEGGWNSAAD